MNCKTEIANIQKKYSQKILVEAKRLESFYPAESYHQDYLDKNKNGYCHIPPQLFEYAQNANAESANEIVEEWGDIKTTATNKMSVKENYDFVEWRLNNGTGDVLNDNTAFAQNATVFAVSKKQLVTITVKGDAGIDIATENTFTADKNAKWGKIKDLAKAKISVKENYDFVEWRLNNGTGDVLNDNTAFAQNATVYAVSKEKVTIAVHGDKRIESGQTFKILSGSAWSSIKAEIEGKIKPSADWKDDWNKGDYAVYEWRVVDENGEKISDDYQFTENTTIYAISNYAKWKIEDDGSGNKVLSGVDGSKPRGKIIIPEDVASIGYSAFNGCSSLKTVDLSETKVREIGNEAFNGCSALETAQFPATLEKIGNTAFNGCSSLKTVDLSGTKVSEIGNEAFNGCTALETAQFPTTLDTIDRSAFCYCSKLKAVDLSGTKVSEIGNSAFYDCTVLEKVQFPATLKKIDRYAFSSCHRLGSVTFADVHDWAVYDYENSGGGYYKKYADIPESDLQDAEKAATLLRNTYSEKGWIKW